MTHLSQSLDAHRHLHGTMTACSWAAGWRSVLLRAYVDPPCVEEFSTAPTPDQLIVLVTAGACAIEGRYRGKWQRAQYQVGNIGMTAPGEAVALRWRGDTSHSTLQLHLPAEAVRRMLQNFSDRDPVSFVMPNRLVSNDPVIQHVMLGMADAMSAGAPDLYCETAREFLLAHLLTRHAGLSLPREAKVAQRRLDRAEELMRSHIDKPLSLEDIARAAGLSRFHTLRLFRRAYGETPIRRLVRLRMDRAKSYLVSGDEPITEIAFRCGYENPAHFAAAFRRCVGVSPGEYRRQGAKSPRR